MALNFHRPHQTFMAKDKQPSVLQNGVLYTKAGRRIPDEVPPGVLDRTFVPEEFQYLLTDPEIPGGDWLEDIQPIVSSHVEHRRRGIIVREPARPEREVRVIGR
mgnify:CR=1 FL=1